MSDRRFRMLTSVVSSRQSMLYCYLLLVTATRLLQCGPIPNTARGDNQLAGRSKWANTLTRHARNVKGEAAFEPYLIFKTKPPVELTLQANSKFVLECEVQGTPNPVIHWLKNGKPLVQDEHISGEMADQTRFVELGLSNVKSRLFLDCVTEMDAGVTYTCVASTPFEQVMANTKLAIQQPASANKEAEYFANQNAIDVAGKDDSYYMLESALTGCLSKKSVGSPARIYFWTQTAMEHIGADVQLHCRASGSPKPVVTWYDSNDQQVVADQKHRVLGTGDLLIRNITFDHMGKYRCVARNVHGTDSVDKVFFYPAKPNADK